ncbi:hypothetical protein [Thalassomonas actiniarum]|uniref:Uncharacterized protein n=1 Tax=Thalassomonas actiniarum TaxID=485447 RepID=A0AAE9YUA9_9GAMM|nr:hypothetical protein [Thalassomonas actiniarum]WDE00455.1 hypothetical protein SG35_007390 [Thalassomonas actiniarum]
MIRHHYQTAILILMVSAPAQAFNNQPVISQLQAEPAQEQVKTPRDKDVTADNTKKTEKKGEDQKQQTVKTTNKQQDTFTPTEEISEDLAVSFPVDI